MATDTTETIIIQNENDQNQNEPVETETINKLDPFVQLPSKAELPEYYKVIKNPMDIYTIYERIETDYYKNNIDINR